MTNMTEQAIQTLVTMEAERMRATRSKVDTKWMKTMRIFCSALMMVLAIGGISIYMAVILHGA